MNSSKFSEEVILYFLPAKSMFFNIIYRICEDEINCVLALPAKTRMNVGAGGGCGILAGPVPPRMRIERMERY